MAAARPTASSSSPAPAGLRSPGVGAEGAARGRSPGLPAPARHAAPRAALGALRWPLGRGRPRRLLGGPLPLERQVRPAGSPEKAGLCILARGAGAARRPRDRPGRGRGRPLSAARPVPSGLTQEPGSVGQLALACAEGEIQWLYPAGALRLTLGGSDPGARPGIACLRPAQPFAGAQVFAERAGGGLELLLAEGPGPAGGRCVRWGSRERRALFLQATPHPDISRRVASFRFELREDLRPELPLQAHGLGADGECRRGGHVPEGESEARSEATQLLSSSAGAGRREGGPISGLSLGEELAGGRRSGERRAGGASRAPCP